MALESYTINNDGTWVQITSAGEGGSIWPSEEMDYRTTLGMDIRVWHTSEGTDPNTDSETALTQSRRLYPTRYDNSNIFSFSADGTSDIYWAYLANGAEVIVVADVI
jgi:hypothetical protein